MTNMILPNDLRPSDVADKTRKEIYTMGFEAGVEHGSELSSVGATGLFWTALFSGAGVVGLIWFLSTLL